MYFDEYYQMNGYENYAALHNRVTSNELKTSDYPLLGFLELAGLPLEQLVSQNYTPTLKAALDTAAQRVSRKLARYWSQKYEIDFELDIRPFYPNDPAGLRDGTNLWIRVKDVSADAFLEFNDRSRGFIWFFSFLLWYAKVREEQNHIILLLDEPGLSLHGKAQGDLLKYFEDELGQKHQLIYTAHSPFMVDPKNFARVRIVQNDRAESTNKEFPKEQEGTKVISEVLRATSETLFPLQAALGYDITQSLFVGPNCLIVEGVSDFLYLQGMSGILAKKGMETLNSAWTITPVGGLSKVSTFVALLGAQKLNLAVLVDYHTKDQQKIENLFKQKLLEKKNVLVYKEFIKRKEADVEDLFDPEFFLTLVNDEYNLSINTTELFNETDRIAKRVEVYFKTNNLPDNFNHYRPARYFNEKLATFVDKIDDKTLERFQKLFKKLNSLLPAE